MRSLIFVLAMLSTPFAHATDTPTLTADALKAKVIEVTNAQNKVMMQGATTADVDQLFSLYTDDFTYVHEARPSHVTP